MMVTVIMVMTTTMMTVRIMMMVTIMTDYLSTDNDDGKLTSA